MLASPRRHKNGNKISLTLLIISMIHVSYTKRYIEYKKENVQLAENLSLLTASSHNTTLKSVQKKTGPFLWGT